MTLMPLSAVLFFEGCLAALEDLKRHQRDREMNNTKTTVLKANGALVETSWANVGASLLSWKLSLVRGESCIFRSH